MTGKIAWIFPGQGSQYAGMGKELCELAPCAAAVFREADDALGFSLSRLCFEGPDSELRRTAVTQPSVLTTSVAALSLLQERGLKPDFAAGHSLGEYSALVAAGSLHLRDAVGLVRKRGTYMQDAVPEGEGAMAAVIGLNTQTVAELCAVACRGEVVSPANLNAPDQIVVAGHREAVSRLMKAAEAEGAKRVIPLEVSAPFHCSLMAPAADLLMDDLEQTRFEDPAFPVICNVHADRVRTGADVRKALYDQVTRPVLWVDTVQKLLEEGVEIFVEIGPGKVLSGLVRRIDRGAIVLNVEDQKSLDRTLEAIGRA